MRSTTAASLPNLITLRVRAPLHKRWLKTTLDCRWNSFGPDDLCLTMNQTVACHAVRKNQDFHFFRLNQIPVSPVATINNVSGSGVGAIGGGTTGGTTGGGMTP